jgi:hypothetical protein
MAHRSAEGARTAPPSSGPVRRSRSHVRGGVGSVRRTREAAPGLHRRLGGFGQHVTHQRRAFLADPACARRAVAGLMHPRVEAEIAHELAG